jgi:hypothetical protein
MEGKGDGDQDSAPAGLSALSHLLANMTQCNKIRQYGVTQQGPSYTGVHVVGDDISQNQ